MKRPPLAIYGAGGFAREVAWLAGSLGPDAPELVCFIEDGAAEGRVVNGTPVLSWEAFAGRHRDARIALGVGDPAGRRRLAAKCAAAGYAFATLEHPGVERSALVELGDGAIVCAGSILTVNIVVERQVHINLDCTVGHDARIGEFSTLAPGVHVSGNVHIGRDVYVGTGANIINGSADAPLVIGDGGVIAAGACVTASTEPGCLYAGVPAVLKKRYP